MTSRPFAILAALSSLPLLAPPPPAHAQAEGLEDIVVTARKREERAQDAPVSVTVFTAESLSAAGVTNFAGIAQRTPGLRYGSYGDLKLSPTSLRGIVSSAGSAGADPAIGFYVDEVYVGQGAGANLDLYDIAQVEVLRGPQGTLFGRNAIGGVISLTTKRPSEDFELSATAEAGNYDYVRGGVSISGPLVGDSVLGKIAFVGQSRGGTEHNELLDRAVNTQGFWHTRGQLLFNFGPETSLLLTGELRRVDQEPLVFETLKYNENSLFVAVLDAYGYPRNADPFDRIVQSDVRTKETLNAHAISATFKTPVRDANLTFIGAYRYHDYYSYTDTDRSPLQWVYDGDPETVKRLSGELRLDGSFGKLDWITGVYVFNQRSSNQSFVDLGADLADLFGDPSIAGLRTGSDGTLTTNSFAGFASLTWRFSERFDLTVGGRYTMDDKRIDYSQYDPLGILGGTARIRASSSWGEFTPNFNLRWHVTPDVMAYAAISKGFKSGGFNDALGDADGIAFGPEVLWNYEAGVKSTLFERRLLANVTLFRMDWDDIQITQNNPDTPIYDPTIGNGGKARSQGVEAELLARPFDALTLGANIAVVDAKYRGGTLPNGTPLAYIPLAPAYTAALNASLEVPLGGRFGLTLLGEYNMQGRTYLTPDNDPDGRVAPYGLLNLRATIRPDKGRWSVALWGKNLTDETYMVRLFNQYNSDLVGQKHIILGAPRTWGVTMRADF
ncbi:TonB-dependent receptor [Sandaracinobacter neustonicus]|uniref:TonB-dependent receptor n=1 Tax=Sandaracinobacter neustonicus TaxID=1715348 RepID=A0A501XLF2_9SPHN|nr:TonB-dependent receptor [Sandaracinobacter neustonicus]TPE61366.1 TonB-dependent receptor [Sandaracinobacter neustonicus]